MSTIALHKQQIITREKCKLIHKFGKHVFLNNLVSLSILVTLLVAKA
jgi:hypothetical protein